MNEEVKKIFETRTKDALSSYISENYFHNNFSIDSFEHTTGWWVSKTKDKKYIVFLVKESISNLDFEVIDKVKNCVSGIYQLKYVESNITLVDLLQHTSNDLSLEQFLKLWEHYNFKGAIKHYEDSDIKDSYWEYFRNKKIEYKVIKQILIENSFLKKYFFSTNIDYIVKNEAGLLMLEIKYKFPSRNNTYGMNSMQYDIYNLFQSQGLDAFNIVLENIDKVDILERENGIQIWKYSRIKQNLTEKKYAPKKTSYDQKEKQGYYELPVSGYHELNCHSNIFNLVCPECRNNLVKRTSAYGKFLGCKQFGTTGCKGKLSF
jgi:hypothetical protein